MPTTKYIWDPVSDNVLMETDENDNTTAVYTHEPGLHGNLVSQNRGGVTSYYHYDGQGSTRALTNDSGDVTDEYTYTAFGEEVSSSGTTENPFRFNGQKGYYFDKETGDYYVRERTYEPSVGRWRSPDPLRFADGLNPYLYAGNDPVNRTDPSGLKQIDSGVQICNTYIKGDWLWSWIPSHGYLLIDGNGYGFFEKNLQVSGNGEVREDDAIVYPPTEIPGSIARGSNYAICRPVKIDDCCIDKDKYKTAVLSYIAGRKAKPGAYTAGVRDCFTFRISANDYAYENSGNGKCYFDKPPANPGTFNPGSFPKPRWKPKACYDCE